MLYAIRSGLKAARTIIDAAGTYGEEQLRPYESWIRRHMRGATPADHGAAAVEKMKIFLGRVVLNSPWFTRHLLLDRWFLHRAEASHSGSPI
jgi:hypothetical protein